MKKLILAIAILCGATSISLAENTPAETQQTTEDPGMKSLNLLKEATESIKRATTLEEMQAIVTKAMADIETLAKTYPNYEGTPELEIEVKKAAAEFQEAMDQKLSELTK